MKTLYFDCSSGASGDMLRGALIDLGVEPSVIVDAARALHFHDWDVAASPVSKNGVRALQAEVSCADQNVEARAYGDIVRLLDESDLPNAIKDRALAAFRVLAEAEA